MGKMGQCFEKNGKAVLHGVPDVLRVVFDLWEARGSIGGDWVLCHGVVTGTGGDVAGVDYAHAWLETEALVFDAEKGCVVLKSLFYQAGSVRDVVRYTPEEARRMVFLTEHWGPWADRFYQDDLAGGEDTYSRMRKKLIKAGGEYRRRGFTEEHDFPGEYRLFVDPRTMKKARLYYHGKIEEY